ncbi:PKHD-type hydroxylase [Acaryochloris thomasi RCC1774]|uniref:PKHD-type hydroxylase n=1 Tax=Acaryochloris thomasi RCC1774 TaxID=1764569 RepID=A0A2W1JRJ6_9CYAN|nr:Fe2+-dependent dioxygenase [Acaryochloris thomasi]PZD72664.1 PKHD-type hydroxylase [Acaryochloris thomasi RCC1774]
MIVEVENVLASEELEYLTSALSKAQFVDGKITAGWHAKQVKQNLQMQRNAPEAADLRQVVESALRRHPLFSAVVRPKKIHSILFSCYEVGMSYGSHVDNALMGQWRSDVSFTLFLGTAYQGGELVIEHADGERRYRLGVGDAIAYPSSTLHRVEPVTDGTRLVAVGWAQSLIRDPQKRELLFDLDTARRSLFAREGKTVEFDLISKSHANLLRQWVD